MRRTSDVYGIYSRRPALYFQFFWFLPDPGGTFAATNTSAKRHDASAVEPLVLSMFQPIAAAPSALSQKSYWLTFTGDSRVGKCGIYLWRLVGDERARGHAENVQAVAKLPLTSLGTLVECVSYRLT